MTADPHDDRLARLDALAGTWDTTITMLAPDGGGEVSRATDIYRWAPSGHVLLHDVDAMMGGERIQSLEVIAPDPKGDGYVTRSYDADGSINDFTARLDGGRWRIVGSQQRFEGHLSADGQALTGQWEQRGTEGWSPLMTVRLERRAP